MTAPLQVWLLSADIGGNGHPGLWTEIGLVRSDGLAIVTVDILLEVPVPGHVGQLHLDHGDLLAPGVRVGPVAVGPEEDVGRGRLSSPLRPLVPRLESEVLPLLQSECQIVSAILSHLIVWTKHTKSNILRLIGSGSNSTVEYNRIVKEGGCDFTSRLPWRGRGRPPGRRRGGR